MQISRRQTLVAALMVLVIAVGVMAVTLAGCGQKSRKSSKEKLLTPQKQQEMMKKMQRQQRGR